MEVRELLELSTSMMVTMVLLFQGSALGALNGEQKWVTKIGIMEAVDTGLKSQNVISTSHFLMPIEDVFSLLVVVLLLPVVSKRVLLTQVILLILLVLVLKN
jgi:translation elongation factor EF-Tu-like GTPase